MLMLYFYCNHKNLLIHDMDQVLQEDMLMEVL